MGMPAKLVPDVLQNSSVIITATLRGWPDRKRYSTTHEFTSGLLWFEVKLFLLKMSFPFISLSNYFSCDIASWHIVDDTQNLFNNCAKIEVIMIVNQQSLTSMSWSLPSQMWGGGGVGGWVQGKNRDPFLALTRLKFPNIVILSINHDSRK